MESGGAGDPFDGLDAPALALEPEHEAGEHGLAVDQNGARAALAELATVFGSRQAEVLAKDLQERLVRSERGFRRFAVEDEAHEGARGFRSAVFSPSRHDQTTLIPLFCEGKKAITDRPVR